MASTRISREQRTVAAMVRFYCVRHGHPRPEPGKLCPDCQALRDYALSRLERCPFQEGKTTCAKCPVHCYQPAMRERIREVMRFAGPRMLTRHPVLALWHMLDGRRGKPLGRAAAQKRPRR